MITIMIGGQARVGKTTLAKWISEYAYNNKYTPVIVPFAAALKEEAAKKGYTKDTNQEEYREFCQTLGSTMRQEDPDYWVKQFRIKIKKLYEEEQAALKADPSIWHEKVIIVDDCRYTNEIAAARDIRALTVFVSAGERELPEEFAEWRTHESEALAIAIETGNKQYEDMFHYTLKNDESEAAFKTKCNTKFDEWFHLLSESMLDDLCNCELCLSSREDRLPDGDTVFKEIMEIFIDKEDDDKPTKT
jgi:hypothetical protein